MEEQNTTLSRREAMKTTSVLAGGATYLAAGQVGATSGDLIGLRHVVEVKMEYSNKDKFPIIHWDRAPNYIVKEDHIQFSKLVPASGMEVIKGNKGFTIIKDVDKMEEYHPFSREGVLPTNQVTEVGLTPGRMTKITSNITTPRITRIGSDGSITISTEESRARIAPQSEELLELSPVSVTISKDNQTQEVTNVYPELMVTNHGEIPVQAPPELYSG